MNEQEKLWYSDYGYGRKKAIMEVVRFITSQKKQVETAFGKADHEVEKTYLRGARRSYDLILTELNNKLDRTEMKQWEINQNKS